MTKLWYNIALGTAHGHIHEYQAYSNAWQITFSDCSVNEGAQLIHPTLDLFFHFVGDVEDKIRSWCTSDYHKEHSTNAVASCFEQNLNLVNPSMSW